MLILEIINDGTGTQNAANYLYRVRVNQTVIASGSHTGHDRADGWQALVREIADKSAPLVKMRGEECRHARQASIPRRYIRGAGWARAIPLLITEGAE